MSIIFGDDPVASEVERVLAILDAGGWDCDESALVDLKEEAGRRGPGGSILPGETENEKAAQQLGEESACMSNTPGGGALIVGAADDGSLIGTDLDPEWLRYRIYQLTRRTLTVEVRSVEVSGVRLLVVTAPQAIEPIRWNGRIRWRVGDHCEEVDLATWHERRLFRTQFDWSAQESTIDVEHARSAAIDIARRFLRASGESHAMESAQLSAPELLRRLNVVSAGGKLTNAGVLAFVGRGRAALDYMRRDVAGGDSRQRVNERDRSLLEELDAVFTFVEANNAVRHLRAGIAVGQIRELPELAVREAIVNGVAHREWGLADPTTIEHIGSTMRVTSPGGFFGGVNSSNIITHPSQSRNRALTELLSAVRIAEREGVGVDRMVREMLRLGYRAPEIEEIEGPFVRASLVGDAADDAWIEWLALITPDAASDVNSLIVLRHLVDEGWIDVEAARPLLQLDAAETIGAIMRLSHALIRGEPVIGQVAGVPDSAPAVWRLTTGAGDELRLRDDATGRRRPWPSRRRIATTYARHRGRIGTTELGDLVGASPSNVGSILKAMELDGELAPSRENRRGPGFYYRWVGAGDAR